MDAYTYQRSAPNLSGFKGGWQINNNGSLGTASPYGTGNKYFANDGVTPLDGNKTSQAIWAQ